MPKDVGFVTMGNTAEVREAPTVGVGMLGYAFMGKAHANGFRQMPYIIWPPPAMPKLVAIAGRKRGSGDAGGGAIRLRACDDGLARSAQ